MKEHFEPALKIPLKISRRDFFAAFALAGFCSNQNIVRNCNFSIISETAYAQADAMIEEAGKWTQNLESTTK